MELEKDYRDFVEKVNIDEIYRQLKFLHETKADKKDVNEKYENHQMEIDAINRRLDALFSQLLNRQDGESPKINIDFSQYVSKTDFEKHKKENEQEFHKIWEEIENLKELILDFSLLLFFSFIKSFFEVISSIFFGFEKFISCFGIN